MIQLHLTRNEISFIDRLGTHNNHNEFYSGTRDKKTLLKGYLASCSLRENWGEIDKASVVSFAETELARLA